MGHAKQGVPTAAVGDEAHHRRVPRPLLELGTSTLEPRGRQPERSHEPTRDLIRHSADRLEHDDLTLHGIGAMPAQVRMLRELRTYTREVRIGNRGRSGIDPTNRDHTVDALDDLETGGELRERALADRLGNEVAPLAGLRLAGVQVVDLTSSIRVAGARLFVGETSSWSSRGFGTSQRTRPG
jgi:hypothetical protein